MEKISRISRRLGLVVGGIAASAALISSQALTVAPADSPATAGTRVTLDDNRDFRVRSA